MSLNGLVRIIFFIGILYKCSPSGRRRNGIFTFNSFPDHFCKLVIRNHVFPGEIKGFAFSLPCIFNCIYSIDIRLKRFCIKTRSDLADPKNSATWVLLRHHIDSWAESQVKVQWYEAWMWWNTSCDPHSGV